MRIRKLMEDKGISAYNVSKETGISQSTLSRVINRDTKLNINNLKTLSKYFKVDKDWLLTGKGSMLRLESITNSNINSNGSSVKIGEIETRQVDKLLDMLKAAQNTIEKQQETINKLIDNLK